MTTPRSHHQWQLQQQAYGALAVVSHVTIDRARRLLVELAAHHKVAVDRLAAAVVHLAYPPSTPAVTLPPQLERDLHERFRRFRRNPGPHERPDQRERDHRAWAAVRHPSTPPGRNPELN